MERVFNGALSLLSVLMAVFTFSFVQWIGEDGRPEMQRPYWWITTASAVLILLSGVAALGAHFRIREYAWPHLLFGLVMAIATIGPLLLWMVWR